jgi:RNA polymerase sigma factor (sigma-70 family)
MRIETRWRSLEPVTSIEEAIAKRAERLKRTIGRFDPERGGVELSIQIEYSQKRSVYEVSGHLHLTNQSRLFAREESHDALVCIGAVIDELARQVRKLKARYETAKKSPGPAAEESEFVAEEEDTAETSVSARRDAAPGGDATGAPLERKQLSRLARTIRRELRYHVALHDLPGDQISPIAVLDDAIATALPRLQEQSHDGAQDVILVQEAMGAVQRRVADLLARSARNDVSMEATAPGQENRDRLDGASETYLAPLFDVSLHFEDLLPTPGASPEDVAATLELEERVEDVLKAFPPVVRSVFLLSTLEDLSPEQVGQALNINEEAARTHLSEAREALRRGLEPEISPELRQFIGLEPHRPESHAQRYSSVAKEL